MKTAEETKEKIMAIISDAVTLRKINYIHKKRIEIILDQFKHPIAEGETVYRKVSVKERNPNYSVFEKKAFITDIGNSFYDQLSKNWFVGRAVRYPEWWLEETTLPLSVKMPSDESIEKLLITYGRHLRMKLGLFYLYDLIHTEKWAKEFIKDNATQITLSKQVEKKEGEATICQHYYVDETINDIYVKKCLECGKIENHKP